MNIILIYPHEWPDPDLEEAELTLSDRRFDYIRNFHKPAVGDFLRVGLLNGRLGNAQVLKLTHKQVCLKARLHLAPPPPSPATLVLALPRPKVLRRTLQAATTLGVKTIYLINSYRVEKSFWQTPFLKKHSLEEQIHLGLEQCQDTIPPEIHLKPRFKPFVEDELKDIVTNQQAIVAHPKNTDIPFPDRIQEPCCIAIGPEGGFIPYEIDLLESIGFKTCTLGNRILKVETAVSVLLGRCL